MTVQFPQIDANEPRLLPDSYNRTSSDRSFEEKLKLEQARLGLLFSPFSQLDSLFYSRLAGSFQSSEPQADSTLYSFIDQAEQTGKEPKVQNDNSSSVHRAPPLQMFESLPSQSLNKNLLQQLLVQTGWLTPNLAAQPQFYNAFLEGKLQLKLDLQLLIDQIVEQVKMVKGRERAELSLMLKPEELGEILLVLTSRSGMVSIQVQTSLETKKLIDSRREELERALKKAHVNFDRIEIREVTGNV